MKIFTALALTLSVFAATTSAVPAPAPAPGSALLGPLTEVLPLGDVGGLGGQRASTMTTAGGPLGSLFRKRGRNHIEDILNALVSVNSQIVAKAILKLKLDLCSDIHAKINVRSTGILTSDGDLLIPKISAKLKSEIDSAVNTKVDLDVKLMVLDRIQGHGRRCISKYCSNGDDRCLRKHARHIVGEVEALIKLDVDRLFVSLKSNLMTHIRAKVKIVVRELGVNLLLEKVHVQATVDAVAQLDLHLDLCAHLVIKGLHVTVFGKVLALIKSILSGLS
ncbi:hypothetical protein BGZ70_008416 [Mortierella alpina]|uniref:Uncharacterized protein n=1 Tax=Mortierella alpina TaxID=64518 RepID=A0A9P6J414_MORAP|nr:hypothetical protein BGZ70_008416 [Mortierella alpina]